MARPKKTKPVEENQKIESVADAMNTLLSGAAEEGEQKTTKAKKKAKMAVGSGFDIFSIDVEDTKDAMRDAGFADGFKSAAEVDTPYLPVPWPAFEWLIGSSGIPVNSVVEFLGPENVGKSTIIFSLFGEFIKHNIPCYYMNTEPKMVKPKWMNRLVSENPAIAEKIVKAIDISERVYTLDQMDEMMRAWVKIKRDVQGIPLNVPLVVAVDSMTKLLNPEEAAALMNIDKKSGKLTITDSSLKDISKKPAVTAKWWAEWSRAAKSFLEQKNVTILLVSGTTQNMNQGPSFIPPELLEKRNKTRIGGVAINQVAGIRVSLTGGMQTPAKNSAGERIGTTVTAYCQKNSFGGRDREMKYILRDKQFADTDTYTQAAMDMEETFCNIIAENGILGTTLKAKRYTCDELGIVKAEAHTFYNAIMANEEVKNTICAKLNIDGYELG